MEWDLSVLACNGFAGHVTPIVRPSRPYRTLPRRGRRLRRLRSESASEGQPCPKAFPTTLRTVTPSIVVTPCAEAIDFYIEAFGAEEIESRMTGPDGSIGHAKIRLGDSVIMLADEPHPISDIARRLDGRALHLRRRCRRPVGTRSGRRCRGGVPARDGHPVRRLSSVIRR